MLDDRLDVARLRETHQLYELLDEPHKWRAGTTLVGTQDLAGNMLDHNHLALLTWLLRLATWNADIVCTPRIPGCRNARELVH